VSRPLDPTSQQLAQRLNVDAAVLEVRKSTSLSPYLHEVVLGGNAALGGEPGNDVMVLVHDNEGRPTRRRYSVRHRDDEENTITLWVATNHDGPGAQWARTCQPGDEVDVVGPRGKITLDAVADWHLFIGDTTGLASFYRMAQAIEVPGKAIFIVEVDTMDDARTATFDEGLGVTGIFVERQGRDYHDPTGLLTGLSAFDFPEHLGQAYLFAEFSVVKTIAVALRDRGLSDEQIRTKSFYRTGRANAGNGEPEKD
jgi:NADPH-dependent ferric siderophore reductase